MFLVDTARHRIVSDAEIKSELASTAPYRDWVDGGLVDLEEIPETAPARGDPAPLLQRQLLFGYHRSEEHTSELQSLMRISYAVFCLKKKKTRQKKNASH